MPPPDWSMRAKPGLRAPRHERDFFMGLDELQHGRPELALQRFEAAARRDTRGRALSDDLLAGLIALQLGQADRAVRHLEAVAESPIQLPDELLAKYVPESALWFELSITPEVGASTPAGSLAAALALVECYQHTGRHEEAIGVLQQLTVLDHDDQALRLSLCELHAEGDDWDDVITVGAPAVIDDDIGLQLLLYRAQAHAERGQPRTAIRLYGEALDHRQRSAELLTEARSGLGRTCLLVGETERGEQALAEIYENDPEFRDVAALLGR
jgi:tetratricopeptide (TPR) repeat protein